MEKRFNHKGHKGYIEREFGFGDLAAEYAKFGSFCRGVWHTPSLTAKDEN
jgi:hypothetical protein